MSDDGIHDIKVSEEPHDGSTNLGALAIEFITNHPLYNGERIYISIASTLSSREVKHGIAIHHPEMQDTDERVDFTLAVRDLTADVQALAKQARGIRVITIRRKSNWEGGE